MSELTGKCKEDFLNYYWDVKIKPLPMTMCKREDLELFFNSICDIFKNALIAEFFQQFQYGGENLFHHYFNYYWNIMLKSMNINDVFNQTIEMCDFVYNKNKVMLSNPSKN